MGEDKRGGGFLNGPRVKLRATLTFEYEANPEVYGTTDPKRIAEIDQVNCFEDLSLFVELLQETSPDKFTITIEPLEKKED